MENSTTVIMSNRACNSMISETNDKEPMKTGGILLGKIVSSVWYVIEAIDPGPNPSFNMAFVDYDAEYVNHVTKMLSMQYYTDLQVLGHWHSNPENAESLSTINNQTGIAFQQGPQQGFMVGLVNTAPLRLSMYHISFPLSYEMVDFKIGDHLVPEELLRYRHTEGNKLMNFYQHCLPYVSHNSPNAHR